MRPSCQKNSERNIGHELRNENDYYLPPPKLEFFKRIPLYSLPAAWNAAGDLRLQQNKTTFKIALKDKLMNEVNHYNVPITYKPQVMYIIAL